MTDEVVLESYRQELINRAALGKALETCPKQYASYGDRLRAWQSSDKVIKRLEAEISHEERMAYLKAHPISL